MITLISSTEKRHSSYLIEKRNTIRKRKGTSLLSKLTYYFAP